MAEGVLQKKPKTAVLLVGHGSALAEGRKGLESLTDMVRGCGGHEMVAFAFLSRGEPDLLQGVRICVEQGADRILLCPCFLFTGAHVRQDLPAEMARIATLFPGLEWAVGEPLGIHPKLAEIVCERIVEASIRTGWLNSDEFLRKHQ